MASVVRPPSTMASMVLSKVYSTNRKIWKPANYRFTFPYLATKHRSICCTNASSWDPPPVTFAQKDEFLTTPTTLFETIHGNQTKTAETLSTDTKKATKVGYIRWPMWLLGPLVLLATGMVPTLWLPISSIFLGPNIASLLSLTGLDCIFNLGASLFLLMADACSRPKAESQEPCLSQAPFGYRFWNMVATISGFIIPLAMLFVSEKGLFQPQLPSISFAILLGPYLLLLAVQMLTEMLTWHWESPVWLVTPVVYETYRVLQLMRGLKLGAELGAPSWTVHTIRGLVCWWVLVLGVQVMRIAWYAGFTAQLHRNESSNVKTTNPKKYCVRPNTGVVLPRSTCDVIVTMQAQKEAPADMQCKDKFLLQSAVASPGAAPKDITPELFNKESGNQVEECKLKVNYVSPPQPPSPVREGSEEGSSPRGSVSDNGTINTIDSTAVPRAYPESHEKSSETRDLISKLTDEKNSAIQQSNKLHQELELLRRQGNKTRGGVPFIYVLLIGFFGILLGYLLK